MGADGDSNGLTGDRVGAAGEGDGKSDSIDDSSSDVGLALEGNTTVDVGV